MNDHPANRAVIPVYMYQQDTQFSLLDVWRAVYRRRLLVALIVISAAAGAVVLSLLLPSVYRAEVFLSPPQPHEVLLKDVKGHPLRSPVDFSRDYSRYDTKAVYEATLVTMNSRAFRWGFFEKHGLGGYYDPQSDDDPSRLREIFEQQFNATLVVEQSSELDAFSKVSFQLTDPRLAAELLNDFVAGASAATAERLLQTVRIEIQVRIEALRVELARQRAVAAAENRDRVTKLEEAMQIAKGMELRDPPPQLSGGQAARSDALRADAPLYLRGENALRAEVEALKSRTSLDAHIENLRVLEEELAYLIDFEIDKSKFRTVSIDQAAVAPKRKVKPRRALIVVALTAVALFGAILLAWMLECLRTPRD